MADLVPSTASEHPVNDRREIAGWRLYDWANSGFTTTVIAALFGPFLAALAKEAVGDEGTVLSLGFYKITAESLYPDAVSLSVLLQFLFLPLLGALADYTNIKKQLLMFFCLLGAAATTVLFIATPATYLFAALAFVVANLSFGASIVFYNAFLNEITTEDMRDKVSSQGFAFGYIGGGVLLAINLALVTFAEKIGLTTAMAVRISLASAGLWWGIFGYFGIKRLKNRAASRKVPEGQHYLTVSMRELWTTFRELKRLPQTLRFLIAYLLYNDGIQTVIGMSAVFLSNELFKAKGLPEDDSQSFLLGLVLMIQFVAFGGALGFERISRKVGTKTAILISLFIWTGVIVYAYALLDSVLQAWFMGAAIALVLGGSQSLSRALFSRMIPHGREAGFYGIYEISERGTSWIGPFIFARVVAETGSYRQAILSLIVLFVGGIVILFLTNTTKAIHDAGNQLPEEAAATHS
ncbi:MFS transporter [Herpetosiphon sp. NSE202]|uniref:MFS transporter n=1 Tax=Herpetosiphon sp. NSE202 TaxID=3351349 RepID=UPI00362D7E31